MAVNVTMLQTRRGEDGNLWTAGNTYSASDAFAQLLISSNLATGAMPQPAQTGLTEADKVALKGVVSGDWIPQAETVLPDEVVRMAASGGVCGVPCYVSRIRCITGTSVALTVYEGAASTATTLLTATLSAGQEATIPGGRLRAINGIRAIFASGSFDFYIGTEG